MSSALRVLSVCTHNRTRSVLAGELLREHLRAAGIRCQVDTAGTSADGLPAIDRAVQLLAARGIDVSSHRSRPIDADVAANADLVITAEQQHVVWIAGRWPQAFDRTYTLPELVNRAEDVGSRGGRPLVEWLTLVGAGRPTAFDYLESLDVPEVADPTGQSRSVWEASFASIDGLTRRLAKVLS